MTREPSFVLAAGGAVVADGVHTAFPRVADARAALASHSAPIIVGALPFDMTKPAALIRPQAIQFLDALPTVAIAPASVGADRADTCRTRMNTDPGSPLRWHRLRDPATGLSKVVLARALRLVADGPLDARTILDRLVTADPAANAYLVDLTAAGGGHSGTVLVGASPELLVTRRGNEVVCAPFAGSAPRLPDPDADEASGAALAQLRQEPPRAPAGGRRDCVRCWTRCAPISRSRPSRS